VNALWFSKNYFIYSLQNSIYYAEKKRDKMRFKGFLAVFMIGTYIC